MRRITARAAVAAIMGVTLLLSASPAGAQARTIERHSFSDAEGRLIGFYSAALSFSPVAAAPAASATPARGGRAITLQRLGLELALVPPLSRTQRTAGFDKPEATNLAPVFPRPRALVALPGGLALEGSWTPPVRVFGVRANLYSVALARPMRLAAGSRLVLTPRLALSGGTVRGAITCGADLGESSAMDDRVYFANVCRGRESDDRFSPRHLLGDVTLAPQSASPYALRPYLGAGARLDRTRFDIGVIRADGSRDPDHPILELRTVRPYAMAGAEWAPLAARGSSLAGELFWAPGSLLTVRALAGVDFAALTRRGARR